MRKLIAIFAVSIFLFNAGGYQILQACLQRNLDIDLEQRLDHESYDPSQLLSVKVPSTSLPYSSSSVQFERVQGEVDINGSVYKFVKRRIFNDSIEFLCLPDQNSTKLRMAGNDFIKTSHDATSTHSKAPVYKIFSAGSYVAPAFKMVSVPVTGISSVLSTYQIKSLNPVFVGVIGQPPDLA